MKLGLLAQDNVHTLRPSDSLDTAIALMEEHNIHHIPVVDQGNVIGMLSDRDLLLAVGWRLECERNSEQAPEQVAGPQKVGEVMRTPALSLSPDNAIHTAATIMVERKISAFPLVKNELLMGIVTSRDLLAKCATESFLGNVKVGDVMTANVISIGPKTPLYQVSRLFHDKHLRHVPVVSQDVLLGIVTDRDVRRTCGTGMVQDEMAEQAGEVYIGATIAMDIMSKNVRTTTQESMLFDAARNMIENQINALPVMDGASLVGILTDTDIIRIVAETDNRMTV